jgi:ribosome-binding protein aMBF1 (putative translation factor)
VVRNLDEQIGKTQTHLKLCVLWTRGANALETCWWRADRGGGMTMSQEPRRRVSLAEARAERIDRPEVRASYEQTRLRFELAEAVRARREEMGLSQRQVAERAGMTQPGLARFEAGGTTPTLLLLERLAAALDLTLKVSLGPAARRSA